MKEVGRDYFDCLTGETELPKSGTFLGLLRLVSREALWIYKLFFGDRVLS